MNDWKNSSFILRALRSSASGRWAARVHRASRRMLAGSAIFAPKPVRPETSWLLGSKLLAAPLMGLGRALTNATAPDPDSVTGPRRLSRPRPREIGAFLVSLACGLVLLSSAGRVPSFLTPPAVLVGLAAIPMAAWRGGWADLVADSATLRVLRRLVWRSPG